MEQQNKLDVVSSWDQYWQGSSHTDAFSDQGASHPALKSFWGNALKQRLEETPRLTIADIASGNGALVDIIQNVSQHNQHSITCIDSSNAAIANIKNQHPSVDGLVCDITALPKDLGSFDLVVSQFGVEYAGYSAILDIAKMVNVEGSLLVMSHITGGTIMQECQVNKEVTDRFIESGFLEAARSMFNHGFKAVKGAPRSAYNDAATTLSSTLPKVEHLISEFGNTSAGETVQRLYSDVADIHGKLPNYDPEETLAWVDKSSQEIAAYSIRMESMLTAAMSQQDFDDIGSELKADGFELQSAGPIYPEGSDSPLAWVLVAKHRGH